MPKGAFPALRAWRIGPEVRLLAPVLSEAFESNDIHPEALAALQLFYEAVERDTATAELARRVLRFLFRARCDQGLRFNS